MGEIEAIRFCPKCDEETTFIFSGSGKNGFCMVCDFKLNPKEKCDFNRVIGQSICD